MDAILLYILAGISISLLAALYLKIWFYIGDKSFILGLIFFGSSIGLFYYLVDFIGGKL